MSDSQPGSPTHRQADVACEAVLGGSTPSMLGIAQLGLRLLGVFLIVEGAGAILGGLVQGVLQARAYSTAGYPVPIDPHSAAWFSSGLPSLLGGLYLVINGSWVLENVFAPSRRDRQTNEDNTGDTDNSASI